MSPEPDNRVGDKAGASNKTHSLWIYRVSRALHLPTWLGVLFLGLVPFPALLIAADLALGRSDSHISNFIVSQIPLTVLLVLLPILGTIYLSRTIENASAYAETLLPRPPEGDARSPIDFGALYSVRFVPPLTVAFYLAFTAIYYEFGSAPTSAFLAVAPAFIYAFFAIWATVWVFAYSMYSIWKVGQMPLTMVPFAEDRTLGLRPFGTASLRLTVTYVALAAINTLLAENIPFFVILVLLAAFSLLGIGFFFLPLFGLHKKLVGARKEELDWVSAEHSVVLREMRAPGGLRDEGLATRLATVRAVREDVGQIHGWPFDTEMIARLITVVILPIILALGAPFVIQYL